MTGVWPLKGHKLYYRPRKAPLLASECQPASWLDRRALRSDLPRAVAIGQQDEEEREKAEFKMAAAGEKGKKMAAALERLPKASALADFKAKISNSTKRLGPHAIDHCAQSCF